MPAHSNKNQTNRVERLIKHDISRRFVQSILSEENPAHDLHDLNRKERTDPL